MSALPSPFGASGPPRPTIIAVSGRAGTGKDFIIRWLLVPMLVCDHPYVIASFADHFKIDAIVKDKLDRKKVYGRKDEHTRILLQKRGTEEGRNLYGPDVWINMLDERLIQYQERGIKYVFITDCRFPNEVAYVRQRGGLVIRINAEDRHLKALQAEATDSATLQQRMSHPSETALDGYHKWDCIIENSLAAQSTVADQVREIVLKIRTSMMQPLTVFCDLDDTLVECNDNYVAVRNQIKEYLVTQGVMTEYEFDSRYEVENNKRHHEAFSRDGFMQMMLNVLPPGAPFLAVIDVPRIARCIHDCEFPPKTKGVVEWIEQLRRSTQVVIVTLGDPVDQLRKLYKLGLHDVPVECVNHKDMYTFRRLMAKYPSRRYVMIGDNVQSDLIAAQAAGIKDTYLVNSKHPVTNLDIAKLVADPYQKYGSSNSSGGSGSSGMKRSRESDGGVVDVIEAVIDPEAVLGLSGASDTSGSSSLDSMAHAKPYSPL